MLETFSGRRASQNEAELRSFIELMKDYDARAYLEIGARHGDTFHEVMINLPVGSFGLAVDYPGALWGTHKSKTPLELACADLKQRGYQIIMILGDSTAPEIIKSIRANAPFDAILIDGDHTFEGVKKDWENYGELGRIIAFHDIVGIDQIEKVHKKPVEVPLLWNEIKTTRPHIEFIADESKMGIGCILQ